MKIRVKKLHSAAGLPKKAKDNDACWDLVCTEAHTEAGLVVYRTGLAIAIPEDHVGLIFPRSSISNTDLLLANSIGVIDPGYTGEIVLKMRVLPTSGRACEYGPGERVGQLMIIPRPYLEFEEVEELPRSERGLGGFGSTGKWIYTTRKLS